MIESLTYVKDLYDDLVTNYSDPRTREWPMVDSPKPTVILVTAYIIFAKLFGPKMMEYRKPFDIKTAMIVYNAIQAIFSLYWFTASSFYGWMTRYSWVCQPLVVNHPHEIHMLTLGWYFFLVRFLEFTDTIFFILRKKFNQVSTLHVVHHSIVPIIFWLGMKFTPAGHYTLAAYLNSFVHFFMYTYYMLAAMGPRFRKYTWWKKYMTKLQLIQFVLVLIHTVNTLISPSCTVPKTFGYIILFQAALFFFLFFSFYNETFAKNPTNSNKNITSNEKVHLENGTNDSIHESLKNGHSKKELRVHAD